MLSLTLFESIHAYTFIIIIFGSLVQYYWHIHPDTYIDYSLIITESLRFCSNWKLAGLYHTIYKVYLVYNAGQLVGFQ